MGRFIVWLNEIQAKDTALVGQKGSDLGQMSSAGLPVPMGFCVTVDAYQEHIAVSDLWPEIRDCLDNVAEKAPADLEHIATCIQDQVYGASLPAPVLQAIEAAAQELFQKLEEREILKILLRFLRNLVLKLKSFL